MAGSSLSITQTALDGVDTAMGAVSDNLANSQTTAFNAETVDFSTLLGEFIGGNPLGGGVSASAITRDFSQGAITQQSSPTDLAIQGNGFFVFQDPSGNQVFSRNGQMTIASNGALESFNGDQVMGFPISPSGTTGGVLGPITIPQGSLPPSASTQATLTGNLDAASPVITSPINPSDPTTYSASVSVQVYDSLGNSHVLTFFFQNAGPAGAPATEDWNWTATLDGSTAGLAGNSGTLGFDANGNVVTGGTPGVSLTASPAGAAPLSLTLNLGAMTQFGSANTATGTADGSAVGSPTGVQVNNNGIVAVSYSNGNTVNVAQVAVATFVSQQGLQLGNSGIYQATAASGNPTITTAGAGGAGQIQTGALESSNVDTTSQLVSLVVLQRDFQANAKALQTEADVLGTLVEMQTN